jgi:lysophospholipase L1-like esterase
MRGLLSSLIIFSSIACSPDGPAPSFDTSDDTPSGSSSTYYGTQTSSSTGGSSRHGSTSAMTATYANASSSPSQNSSPSRDSTDCGAGSFCGLSDTTPSSTGAGSTSMAQPSSSLSETSTPTAASTGASTSGNDSSRSGSSFIESTSAPTPTLSPTIWLAGDSTVANGNTPCPTGWGKHLASFFDESTTVRNSAVGGRSVRTWTYNVQTTMDDNGECDLQRDGTGEPTVQDRWQEMLDNMKSGDVLLIQFGINDGSATCDRHVGLEAFEETYGVLAQAAKARGAQPVFITPVSAIACSGNAPTGTRGGYVDATIDAGDRFDVPVLELHERSIQRYAELGFCPVSGGDVSATTTGPVGDYFCDDHTHFSSSGAVDIASLVVELLITSDLLITTHLQ